MRKSVILSLGVIAVLAGCQFEESYQEDSLNGFDVSLESIISEPETKTYADEQHLVVWHNDDRVSVFEKKEYWEEYKYTGRTGTTGGRLTKVTSEGSGTGGDLDYYYAVYPHSELNGFNNQGHLLLTLPHEQPYDEFSFGRGTNLMVSASEEDSFAFKNIGGYLVFKLYGEGVSVSSIRVAGNNGEEITGDIDVVVSPGTDPVTTMSTARYAVKYNDAVLVCDPPVALGATAAEYKEFWFVLPPMTFTGGFSIEVTTSDGNVWTKTTGNAWTIKRNHYSPVSAMEVVVDDNTHDQNIDFAYDWVKSRLVGSFDTNGDGEISLAEAAAVTSIGTLFENSDAQGDYTFDEFRFFTGVKTLEGGAFRRNTMVSIVLPNGLTTIDAYAFSTSKRPISITVPPTLSCIKKYAFFESTNGCDVYISDLSAWCQIEFGANPLSAGIWLNSNSKGNIYLNGELISSLSIPESVSTIPQNSFSGSTIKELFLHTSVISIGENAFTNSLLQTVGFNEGLNSIGSQAFASCTSLTRVDLPSSISSIGMMAFYNCTSLTSITIYAVTPPAGGTMMFESTNECPIYVPAESVEEYKTAQYWSNYADRIQAIPEAIDLGLSVKWASFNIGASTPEEVGYKFAWGETEPKSNFSWETYKWCNGTEKSLTKYNSNSEFGTVDNKSILDEEDDAAHVMYGGPWRMPTREEANELYTYCEIDVNYSDEIVTFTSKINGNSIVFPMTSYRNLNVWTKSLSRYSSTPVHAAYIYQSSNNNDCWEDYRFGGANIRAVFAE
ncbi:MAG: leucine-rich repeat protein [Bacteroidales bacterium]|nr:leucine-rich repeat protein [Bacteroidales bacterium]